MIIAIIVTIFASFLWAITNHLDKILVSKSKNGNNIKTLLIFSSLVAGIIILPIWLVICKFNINISLISLTAVFLGAVINMLATYLYLKSLEKCDASVVAVIFQLIPVFSYLLALLLFNEVLTFKQTIGSLIILSSAIIIAIDFKQKSRIKRLKPLIVMLFSSLCFSIYYILFDVAIRNSSYNSCAFWYQVSLVIVGIILFGIKSFREEFINSIKLNGKKFFSLNVFNEGLNLFANLLANFANVLIPIALVNVLNGFQGTFVFIIGLFGMIFLPKYFHEDLSVGVVIQKVICIIMGIFGSIIMFF